MTTFPDSAALDYDERIVLTVPGYTLAQAKIGTVLKARLQENASILIAGCGTGGELILLANTLPKATFTAIEPSKGMIDVAKRKAQENGCIDRIQFICQTLEETAFTPHDAAVCSLVLHFINDSGAKETFLSALAKQLMPKAPLIIMDYMLADLPENAYFNWLVEQGADPEQAAAIVTRIDQNWHPVNFDRFTQLLNVTGFETPTLLLSTLNYHLSITQHL